VVFAGRRLSKSELRRQQNDEIPEILTLEIKMAVMDGLLSPALSSEEEREKMRPGSLVACPPFSGFRIPLRRLLQFENPL